MYYECVNVKSSFEALIISYFNISGRSLRDRLNYSEAIKHFDRAIELDPSFAPYYLHAVEMAIIQRDTARVEELRTTCSSSTGPSPATSGPRPTSPCWSGRGSRTTTWATPSGGG